ncbi:glycosyltransferase family 4 protein [Vibrio vulnificus]|uniref:glycosyltransferase family 4 protein n=1 Tax=Vibrio vulnificus TaxID=672 RepID=UPI00072299A0|nr:glycosyltransferase family 4 protein [Vibrio vulnificus]ALM72122.1 Glycosyltransferase [Vibrio vulnificus]ANH62075.1 Glycosyltransferase [Vibrio vulnificus]
MKKIAVVDPASYALTYDYQYIKSLADIYHVDFYCSSTKYNYDYIEKISNLSNVEVIEYKVSNVNKILGLFNLIRLYFDIFMSFKSYSSINIQWSVFPFVEIPIYVLLQSKLVYTFHNSKPHNCKNDTTISNRLISRLSKINLFVSEYTKKVFESNYNAKSKKSFILNHGIMPLTDRKISFSELNSYDNSQIKLVFWGNIKPYKGVDFLLNSVPSLKGENISLQVYGKYDDDLLYIHEELIKNNVISNNGYLPLYEIEKILLEQSNLLVLPYKNSSQSGIMYNCLALGVPFISSNTGEAAQFLKKYDLTGLIFDYGDVESLLESINYYKKNQFEVIKVFESLKNEYSWSYDHNYLREIFE